MRSSAHGLDYVYLDISHREPDFVREHFPNIYESCSALGIDITQGADPGRPGAALHLRRRGGGPPRPHRRARAVRGRRGDAVRACTAPTAWRRTACSNASCSAKRRRKHIVANWRRAARRAADPRMGRKPGHRQRRGGRHRADLGRNPPLHVELRRHRPHRPSGWSARSTASTCCARKCATITRTSASRRT